MQVIYIDVLFFMNFMMDLMIFNVGINLIGKKVSKFRWIVGSLLAALLYCLVIYFPELQTLPYYIYYLLIPIIPILYIFEALTWKEFLRNFTVCTFSAFLIGGGTFNFYYLFRQVYSSYVVSLLLPLGVGMLICIIIILSFRWIRKKVILPQFEYDITLHNLEKKEKMEGIVDTGNCLYTLIGHRPVTVVSYERVKALLGERERELLSACERDGIIQTISQLGLMDNPLTIIPFKSVGCKEGIILGVQMEKMSIRRGSYHKEFGNCMVGICFEPIFKECKYEVLVHPDFIIN